MTDLQNSQQQSEPATLISNFKASLLVAFERTGTEPKNIDNIITDVLSEFKNITSDEIIKAMKNGSLGKYGKTYKLCTQDVCIWIREYRKSKRPINLI